MTLAVVIALIYLAAMLIIGFRAARGETAEGFLIGERKLQWWRLGITVPVGWFGALFLVWYAYEVQVNGWSYLWVVLSAAVPMVLMGLLAGRMRKFAGDTGSYTMPDVYYHKFSKRVGLIVALVCFVLFWGWFTAQFVIGGDILSRFTGVSYQLSVILLAGVTLAYVTLAGFRACVRTDVPQFILIFITLLLLLGSAWLTGRITQLPPAHTLWAVQPGVLASSIVGIAAFVFAGMDIFQRIFAARSEKDAKRGMVFAGVVYAVGASLIGLLLMVGLPHVAEGNSEVDLIMAAFTAAAGELLLPLIYLLLMAALMSTIDTTLFGTAMAVANDMLVRQGLIARENLVKAVRIAMVIIVVGSVFISFVWQDLVTFIYLFMSGCALLMPSVLVVFLSRKKLNEPVLFYSLIAGLVVFGYVNVYLGHSSGLMSLWVPAVSGFILLFGHYLLPVLRNVLQSKP